MGKEKSKKKTKKKADTPQKQDNSNGYGTVETCISMKPKKQTFKGQ